LTPCHQLCRSRAGQTALSPPPLQFAALLCHHPHSILWARCTYQHHPAPPTRSVFGDACEDGSREVAQFADIIWLCTKPQAMPEVLAALAPHVTPKHLVVSSARLSGAPDIKTACTRGAARVGQRGGNRQRPACTLTRQQRTGDRRLGCLGLPAGAPANATARPPTHAHISAAVPNTSIHFKRLLLGLPAFSFLPSRSQWRQASRCSLWRALWGRACAWCASCQTRRVRRAALRALRALPPAPCWLINPRPAARQARHASLASA
jgi:hypothetical protein